MHRRPMALACKEIKKKEVLKHKNMPNYQKFGLKKLKIKPFELSPKSKLFVFLFLIF
jgi:hypothetical protein